jgi:uncharacterized membrane protein YhiD involved in acid resistance
MACGAGFYWAAVIATAISLVSLGPLRVVSRKLGDRTNRRELEIDLAAEASAAPVLEALEQLGVEVTSFSIAAQGDGRRLSCAVELPKEEDSPEVVLRLSALEDVMGARWTR